MIAQKSTRRFRGYAVGLCVGALALASCGRETFLPSAAGDFEPRTLEDEVLVLDVGAPNINEYQAIGTALIKAKKDLNAVKGCRAVAAENGGDAILSPESKGPKQWKCTVLRRKGSFTSEN